MGTKITVQARMYRRDAQNLVLDMLRYNTLSHQFTNKSGSSVIKRFNGLSKDWELAGDFSFFVEQCRDYLTSAPFENLADSGVWHAEGSTLSVTDSVTGQSQGGYDTMALTPYQGLFNDSLQSFKNSLVNDTYNLFKNSIVNGIASIEAFLRQMADYYNHKNPQTPLLDNHENKVSFIDKFDKWIPTMTGRNFNKGGQEWASLKILIGFRDNNAVHLKGAYGFKYSELLSLLNIYKYGIPGILKLLLIHFNIDKIPSNIIRACYFPQISIDDYDK